MRIRFLVKTDEKLNLSLPIEKLTYLSAVHYILCKIYHVQYINLFTI